MSFDESERDELASEIYTVTNENVLQRTRSVYDSETEKITNEIAKGLCATCGRPLVENNFVMCYYGDLACNNGCASRYNGRSICRKHVEYYICTKTEAVVLVSIMFGLDIKQIKDLSGLSTLSIRIAKNNLRNRGYIEEKSFGFSKNRKITDDGIDVVETLVSTYRSDLDFATFLKRIGWGNVETGKEE